MKHAKPQTPLQPAGQETSRVVLGGILGAGIGMMAGAVFLPSLVVALLVGLGGALAGMLAAIRDLEGPTDEPWDV